MKVSELNKLFLTGKKIKYKSDQIIVSADKVEWLYHGNVIASRTFGNNYMKIYQGWHSLSVSTKRRLNNFNNIRLYQDKGIIFLDVHPFKSFQYFDGSAIVPIPAW